MTDETKKETPEPFRYIIYPCLLRAPSRQDTDAKLFAEIFNHRPDDSPVDLFTLHAKVSPLGQYDRLLTISSSSLSELVSLHQEAGYEFIGMSDRLKDDIKADEESLADADNDV